MPSCNVVFLIFPIHTTFQSEIINLPDNINFSCISRQTVLKYLYWFEYLHNICYVYWQISVIS
jgi:hypothetical protein